MSLRCVPELRAAVDATTSPVPSCTQAHGNDRASSDLAQVGLAYSSHGMRRGAAPGGRARAREPHSAAHFAGHVFARALDCFLVALLLGACGSRAREPFDSARWKRGGYALRAAMSDDFCARESIVGIRGEELLELLGPPDRDTTVATVACSGARGVHARTGESVLRGEDVRVFVEAPTQSRIVVRAYVVSSTNLPVEVDSITHESRGATRRLELSKLSGCTLEDALRSIDGGEPVQRRSLEYGCSPSVGGVQTVLGASLDGTGRVTGIGKGTRS